MGKQRGYFMSNIQVNNNILNLVQLQEELDGILFDYIDTSQKWNQAFERLEELLRQTISYFTSYVRNEGKVPEGNVFWALYMDIVAKIIYYKTLSYMNLETNSVEKKDEIIKALHDAVNCLPNVEKRNHELLQEISNTYEKLELFNGNEGEFERHYIEKNNTLEDCIKYFNEFCKNEVK